MTFQSLDSVKKIKSNSGTLETHGDHTGENKVSSELLEEPTTLVLKLTALGPLQKIHGLMMKDITLPKLNLMTH
jgi:hypothetical protein